jgi:hypothetical protein
MLVPLRLLHSSLNVHAKKNKSVKLRSSIGFLNPSHKGYKWSAHMYTWQLKNHWMDFHENEIETFMTNCHANSCIGMKHTHLMSCTYFCRCCGYGIKNRKAVCTFLNLVYGKAKAIAVQACTGPWGSRGWGCQISSQSTHEGGKIVGPTHWPPLPPRKYSLVLGSVTPWVEPRTIVQL